MIRGFRNIVLQNFPFLEKDFDALTDYEFFSMICGYVLQYQKDNEYMMNKIKEFQSYFDNLDVQEEVDKKLEEMALSGELEEIIIAYTTLKALITYDSVSDMVASENLISGSRVKTLGFYSLNDGGGATYKIRTKELSDVADNIHLFDLTNNPELIAELIVDDYNILKFGAKDGEDSTDAIKYVLSIVNSGDVVIIPKGNYNVSEALNVTKSIIIEGTSVTNSSGSTLTFDGSNGLVLKSNYITIRNINITGTNKINYGNLNINNNTFGTVGVVNEYADSFTNGGCILDQCNVHGFNVGVVIYSTQTNPATKWAGAYREFINCNVSNNDIGYLIKDGATYNTIKGGHIASNNEYGIYVDANILYQNLEVIDTSLELNGAEPPFTTNVGSFGVYVNKESKVAFTNSYLEKMSVFVDNGGSVIFFGCHIHNNVQCFGDGNIESIGSHGIFANKYNFGDDLAGNCTDTGLTLTNTYGSDTQYLLVESSNNGDNRLNFPNLTNLAIPLKDVDFIKFEIDAKTNGGYQNDNYGIKPDMSIVGYGDGNTDNIDISSWYSVKDVTPKANKWSHLTYYWKPRLSTMDNLNQLIYRISVYLFFNNVLGSYASDFSVNNLILALANPVVTIYAKTNTK